MSQQSSLNRSILIYNPISGHGHLDSWNAMFVSIFLDAGWIVNILTPDKMDLLKRLQSKRQVNRANLNILNWDVLKPTLIQRAVGRIKRQLGIAQNQESDRADLDPRFLDPVEFAQRVNAAFEPSDASPSFVFNMYMDMYPGVSRRWNQFEEINNFPWAGIRFVPSEDLAESYYSQIALKGMCLLDSKVCEQLSHKYLDKVFEYLPDITETALPPVRTQLVQEIESKAHGRKIVFMGGTIGGNKNLVSWYQLITLADAQKYYFVQIGEILENNLTPEDLAALFTIQQNPPENLFIKAEYLPDEAMFNEIIQASDVIFAVYRNFKISSNMPGKAASFNKPILVAKGYLMGRRVEEYEIGLAVVENDVTAMRDALNQLISHGEQMKSRFEKYRRDFSPEALGKQLIPFIERCMTQA